MTATSWFLIGDLHAGRELQFRSWRGGDPRTYRIVGIYDPDYAPRGAGRAQRCHDKLRLQNGDGTRRTITAFYVRNSAQWSIVA